MKLTYSEKLGLPVSDAFKQLINDEVSKHQISDDVTAITLNYRDSLYTPEDGGFHPVELRFEKKDNCWHLAYLTDFSYAGLYSELEKEIDFDVTHDVAFIRFMGEVPLSRPDVQDFFKTYQANFISYVAMEAYDDVKLTVD
ncbi:TPA: DUF2787 family protein [Vibrio parahaemolyticus]|nr:DUF2787 family protein [Vibrio parahaemolyticus]